MTVWSTGREERNPIKRGGALRVTCDEFAVWARAMIEGRNALAFVSGQDNTWRECRVFFRNATTGLEVVWDYGIDVRFGPLVYGALPPAPAHDGRGVSYPSHYLSALVALRAPSRTVGAYELSDSPEVGRANLEVALREVADALFEVAADVLDGDFSVFHTLDEAAWSRGEVWRDSQPQS